jgi:hypothetical protein
MSGKIMSFARKGSVAERIADLWLSMIGVCTPVRHEDDYGFDFHCELADLQDGKYVSFHSPFMLQVKSSINDGILYGESKPERWKSESINWLFRNKMPLFIGVVDVKTLQLSLYDTSGLWQVYNENGAWSSQIQLVSKYHPEGEMRNNIDRVKLENWEEGKGDGYRYVVDLGNPVVIFSWSEVENKVMMDLRKAHLTGLIYLEKKNILNRDLGMRVFLEIKANEPGSHTFMTGALVGGHPNLVPDKVMSELLPGLVSLTIKLKLDGREDQCKALSQFLATFEESLSEERTPFNPKGLYGYLREQGFI